MPGQAVVTMELQRGVCGDLATITPLADAVLAAGVATQAAKLATAARAAGLPVIHCTFSLPPDRTGLDLTSPLMRSAVDDPSYLLQGTDATALLPGLAPNGLGGPSGDLASDRSSGMTPWADPDFAVQLERLDIDAVVVCGVSLNVGIPGLVIGAIDRGYDVTVAVDATVGLPAEYGELVLRNTLKHVARLAAVDEIIAGWSTTPLR